MDNPYHKILNGSSFLPKKVSRELFQSSIEKLINADLNEAFILRKV